MKLGQTSFIQFLSRMVASLLGFIATIYFARLLGAEPLGIYNLVLGIVSWLGIIGSIGLSGAIIKRVSEGKQREQYATAGILSIMALFAVLAIGIVLFRSHVDSYIGRPVTEYVVLILFVTLSYSIVTSLLNGLNLVHISGVLSPIKTGGRSLLQISAVAIGFGLTGLYLGYIIGYLLVIVIGSVFVFRQFEKTSRPKKHHFQSLFDYAKFAWLGNLQSRMFNYTDILVLGFFVSSTLVGVYAVAWNIAHFLILFASAISTSLFPEMSSHSTEENPGSVANLVEDALSYTGLFLIPGLIGGAIIGERILGIYGSEFTQGSTVLIILVFANLIMSYQNQILNTLNAVDRPDLSFRANALFVVANVLFNVILIYSYGWLGAAVATTLSVALSLIIAYYYLQTIVDFTVPFLEIGRQWIAAILMGFVVYSGLWIEESYRLLSHNFATVIILISIGAMVYFVALFALSSLFRDTLLRNIPFDISLYSR
jgi:O-antigen/teichoic acid export membrane protein